MVRKSRNAKREARAKHAFLPAYYHRLHSARVGTTPRIDRDTLYDYHDKRLQKGASHESNL